MPISFQRRLPNGVAFGSRVLPGRDAVRMEMWLRNGTKRRLTGLVVQNTGNETTDITVTYYDVLGTQVGDPKVRSGIGAKRSAVFTPWDVPDPGMPSNFYGSAIITSSGQPFAGQATYRGVGSGDINATFNACAP